MSGVVPVQETAVMFDSFYYAYPTTSITVKCRVLVERRVPGSPTQPQWLEHTYSAPAYNKAASFGLDYLEEPPNPSYTLRQGATVHNNILGSINYPRSLTRNLGWTYSSAMNPKVGDNTNVFFYAGHSSPDWLTDGQHLTMTGSGWHGAYIWANATGGSPNLSAMRIAHVGQGSTYPPFNSGTPAINIATLLSCDSVLGGISNFDSLLYPFFNGYGKLLETQCFVGFSSACYLDTYATLSNVYTHALVDGKTTGEAVAEVQGWINTQYTAPLSNMRIHGLFDAATRLTRVYEGGGTANLRWWRTIPMP
jgi:hypothetical protein